MPFLFHNSRCSASLLILVTAAANTFGRSDSPVVLTRATVAETAAVPAENALNIDAAARSAGQLTLYFENDYFRGTDRYYTNGFKVSWLSADLNRWGESPMASGPIRVLAPRSRDNQKKNLGFSFGQQIYTPADRARSRPDPLDRPYAGWSYLEVTYVQKNTRVASIFSVQAGIVGPSSWADRTQGTVHRRLGLDVPAGWKHQLRDEAGVNLILERRLRFAPLQVGEMLVVDYVPYAGVSLGNVQSHLYTGTSLRAGYRLPSDFGLQLARGGAIGSEPLSSSDPRLSAHYDFSVFLIAGFEARAVARDIFLDGNTFKDSPSVRKEPVVADLYAGVGVILGRWQLTGLWVDRTKEFKSQGDYPTRFGSLSLSYTF